MRKIIFVLFVLCCFGSISFAQEGNGISAGKVETNEKNEPLKILSMPRPGYTEEARKNRISGPVKLKIEFAENGKIGEISVVEALPNGLTEQAIKAARGVKFRPARKDGKNISVTKILPFNFMIS